jgi:hypothetical protein
MRNLAVLVVLLLALTLSGAPKSAPIAPEAISHPIALFLNELSNDGKRQVTFKASAIGTRFYFEEASGVTVYRFANGRYVKEKYLPGARLASAIRRSPKL